MKTAVLLAMIAASGAGLVAQEKPVPKDSERVYVPGCADNRLFVVSPPREDQPGRSSVPAGTRLRMNGPKKLLDEIKAHRRDLIELTGLIRKGQFEPGGVRLGPFRVTPGPPPGSSPMRSPNVEQVIIDVEGWRILPGECPDK
ncbi:MAG: hypothetical protein AB7O67_18300 [Vicinamibacterales bacterium]